MFRTKISFVNKLTKIKSMTFCDPIIKTTEYTPIQDKLKLEDFLTPHPIKGEPPIYNPSKKSKLLKKDPYNYPTVKTLKHPESKEEINDKFKKEPNFTSKFKINYNDIDDYLIVGAEIFKNKFKEQSKEDNNIERFLDFLL